MPEGPTFAQRFADLAHDRGDAPAVSFQGVTVTFADFDALAVRWADHYLSMGVQVGDMVTIALPNSIEFLTATAGCWKIGAVPQPVSSRLPRPEIEAIVELADSKVVVGAQVVGRTWLAVGFSPPGGPASLDPACYGRNVSPHWKAPTSGGSTGRPKLIVSGDPSIYTETLAGLGSIIGAVEGETTVMPGPLYHNGPFIWSFLSLLSGAHVALLGRFDAQTTLAEVQRHRASAIYLVPTMMQRIWKLADEAKFGYDLSSLRVLFHLAEPCPVWLKQAWIDWLGPEVIYELYGGTEGQMFSVITGMEWLEHVGSVGRPISGEVKIMSPDGHDLAPGEQGEVWMRSTGRDRPTYHYLGDTAEVRDGWECLGDMGWVDEDGYLYLGDRRKDMILVGGANVYPAEVEAAIGAHDEVLSSAVVGLPDDDKGSRIHAIVQRVPGSALSEVGLAEFLGERLVRYKIPRSFEWVTESLRDDAGKVRRSALVAERS